MATITHTDFLDGALGNPTHSTVDFNADTISYSLLDQTDSGTITASMVDYAEVNGATVVYSTDLTVSTVTGGVVTITAPSTASSVTGDAADYLTMWKDSGSAATSPLIITWDSATSGLPVTPNGGDIVSTWGSNQILTFA